MDSKNLKTLFLPLMAVGLVVDAIAADGRTKETNAMKEVCEDNCGTTLFFCEEIIL